MIRNSWMELNFHFSTPAITYETSSWYDARPMLHICLWFGNFFFRIPFLSKYPGRKYGIKYHDRILWLHYGKKYLAFYMFWNWELYRKSYLMKDGSWFVEYYNSKKEPDKNLIFQETHEYSYTRKSGEVQKVNATITVDGMEWRWRWFKWLKYPCLIRKSIWADFSGELGERTGSWKGGVTGCGYTMHKDETPLQCLRRMEKERKFN